MDKICLDCGNLLRGRADKKFCDDQCRNNYNNRLNAIELDYLKKVNRILAKNRLLLKQAAPDGKTKIKKSKLLKEGFSFEFYTHHLTTQTNNQYTFCYEYGYLNLDNEEVLIVKREKF